MITNETKFSNEEWKDDIKMIKWINADTPPAKCDFCKQYLVTCEYNGLGNIKEMKCKWRSVSV